jgi:tripartite-type tricarboxylate transporter receptor subunit TctC
MKMQISRFLGLLFSVMSLSSAALAQEYPSKRVEMIVPFASGGAVDSLGRLMSAALTTATKQSFFVINRPGAGGIPALAEVAKSTPDATTLGVGSSGTLTISPILFSQLNFDPLRDVEPVIWFANSGIVLVARPDLEANTVAELIALSKKSAGSINMASAGTGSIIHLAGEYFQSVVGVKWTHVPYKGSAPALMDMMGSRVDVMTDSAPSAAPYIKAGKLKALAVTTATRLTDLPDVPTLKELGYEDFDVGILYGLVAPKGTPQNIITFLNTTLNKALQTPEMISRLAALGFEPVGGSPERLRDRIGAELQRWKTVIGQSQVEIK